MVITLSPTDLFMIIATVAIIVLLFFLVPFLIQLKQTARRAEALMEDLERDIPAILSSARNSAAEIQKLTESINHKMAETDEIFRRLKYATGTFLMTGKVVRSTLVPALVEIAGVSTGIKAFLHVLHRSKSKKTKGDPDK
ncbi:MAG: DUF948 domain-containing protein [Desulfobulbaceae bacterium]|nr:DUF948 domain-containing protein [Desulfobulbaceae bacterium]